MKALINFIFAMFWASTVAASAQQAQKPSLTRVWVGEEMWQFGGKQHKGDPTKSWRLIPGSKLTLRYSGTGPLPGPVDFIIPLAEALPLGTVYYLSVKNWYVGKMEATLGDITQALETPRYDWTPVARFEPNAPVDKITLRYFPSTLVADTGKAQEQPYVVQGVFISTEPTQVPFEGGEIVSLRAQKPPAARPGNYFENGSFETGLYPWGPTFDLSGASLIDAANLDDSTAAHGSRSLKLAANGSFGLNHKMVALPPGKYTLSFHAKADKNAQLQAAVRGLHTSLKDYADTDLKTNVKASTEWKRYSVTQEIKEMPGFLYTVELKGSTKELTHVWLDAIQLAAGEATGYQPGYPVEVGYVSDKPGNIYYTGEPATVDVLLHSKTGQPSATVEYQVENYWGKQVAQGSKVVSLQGMDARVTLPLFDQNQGIFRILFTTGDSRAEMIYSVLPPNPHLKSKHPEGTLGADAHLHDPKALAILKRANFNWVLEKQIARWATVEPEQDQYQFFDDLIKNADEAKVMLACQLFNMRSYYRHQPWMAPYILPFVGGRGVRDPGIWREDKKGEFFKHWTDYVFATVDHYKASVQHWEVFNEPNSELGEKGEGGEQYGYALKASAEAIRRADPQAKVIGFAGGGFNREFYDAALKVAGPDAADVLSVHFYGSDEKQFAEYADLLAAHQKPGWNSETGQTCRSFFTTLPGFAELQQPGHRERELQEVHTITQHSVKNYLLSLSLGRMEKWFYYFARFTNASPSQPTGWTGGKEITEYDGSLRANGVGLTIASHFMDGAKHHGSVPLDEWLQTHVFQKGGGSVGFLWSRNEQTLTLSAGSGLTFYDIMGARIAEKVVRVTDSPVYFTFDGESQACAKRLGAAKVGTGTGTQR